jgi:hypothetical protein
VKEQGDYNLKYLIAAPLLDDQLGPAQLEEARIQAPDTQALLRRVEIRPDERFSARYPCELSARVTIRTKDQRIFVKEQWKCSSAGNNSRFGCQLGPATSAVPRQRSQPKSGRKSGRNCLEKSPIGQRFEGQRSWVR